MALVTMKEILEDARRGNYAVPAIDALDKVTADAVVRTADKLHRPLILMVPESGLPFVEMESYFTYLVDLVKSVNVPIALELDHGKSYETIVKAIHYGFTGVMIDGSELPYEENVAVTRKIVEVAHAAGVSVEAEIGHVAGGEGNMEEGSEVDVSMYTKPEDAQHFAEDTGIDAMAIAFGTVHGVYRGTPKLDLNLLEDIKGRISIPLVMHGGSGVSDEEFKKAIKAGINKINLFTEISMASAAAAGEYYEERNHKLHFAELLLKATTKVEELTEHYIELFK